MSATLNFYSAPTCQKVDTISADIIGSPNFNLSVNGSENGDITVIINNSNQAFLRSLKENSHFIAFSIDGINNIFGGVIDSAVCNVDECHIKYCGFSEYLDKIRAVSSFHVLNGNVLIKDEDKSWIKNLVADTPEGLLYELFINLKERLDQYTYNGTNSFSQFWEFEDIFSVIAAKSTGTWKKNYQINSAELPTMKTIVDDILTDPDCSRFDAIIKTDNNTFKWSLSFDKYNHDFSFNTAIAPIYDLTFELDGIKARINSLAKGEDDTGNTVISGVPFASNVAFSDFVNDETTNNATANVSAVNRKNISSLKKMTGQCSFKTQDAQFAFVNSTIHITADTDIIDMLVTQVAFDGKEFTITGNTVGFSEDLSKLKGSKPANLLSDVLGKPLGDSYSNSRKSLFEEPWTTGWRNL